VKSFLAESLLLLVIIPFQVWGKTKEKIYGPNTGTDYQDNQLRFSLLCQAALEAPRILNLDNNPYYSGPYGMQDDQHT
jgi:hypothetical protein